MAPLRPFSLQRRHPIAHRQGHASGPQGWLRTWKQVIEDDHDAVAEKADQRPLELKGDGADQGIEFAEDFHDFFRLSRLGKAVKPRKSAKNTAG
jgi:hypothetical protein